MASFYQVKVLGWGPRQYAPIHDHPLGGCLQKIIRGPGLYERFFLKTKDLNTKSSIIWHNKNGANMTGTYTCYSSLDETERDSCKIKNSDKAFITEMYSKNATANGELFYIRGYDLMHYVENSNDEDTLHLQYCLGEYRISWWLDPQLEAKSDIKQRPRILKSLNGNP